MAPKQAIVFTLMVVLLWGCSSASPTEQAAATITPQLKATQPQSPKVESSATAAPETPTPEPISTAFLTPTLGTPITRTPAPEEECPAISVKDIELTSEAPGNTVVKIFEKQLLDYLNATGSASRLPEKLGELTMLDGAWEARVQVETIDVTGNTTPEVVIELTFFEAGQYSEGALFIFRCQEGNFVGGALFSVAGQVLRSDDPDGIRAIRDMNANGVPEIVHSHITIAGTHGYFTREFSVMQWDGNKFVDLIPPDEYGSYAWADTGDGVIRDLDGNGTYELILSNSLGEAYGDLGPQRKRNDIWEWTGYVFERTRWEYTEPVFRIHAIWDGDDAMLFGDYEAALAFYQQAVFDEELLGWSRGQLWPDSFYGGAPTPVPDPEERHRLNAYGRYRILLLHVVQGNLPAAEVVYNTLQDLYGGRVAGSQYGFLGFLFWEQYLFSSDIVTACLVASVYAEENSSDILDPLGKRFYGIGQREYEPEDICPFGA
jgi:hypothetical protein